MRTQCRLVIDFLALVEEHQLAHSTLGHAGRLPLRADDALEVPSENEGRDTDPSRNAVGQVDSELDLGLAQSLTMFAYKYSREERTQTDQ